VQAGRRGETRIVGGRLDFLRHFFDQPVLQGAEHPLAAPRACGD
jgi:hypothetical protein